LGIYQQPHPQADEAASRKRFDAPAPAVGLERPEHRWSSPEQAKGDSLRRQTEAAARWCQQHTVKLDASRTYRDEGVSGFKGGHRKGGNALAAFLTLVEAGKVAKGSHLIVENLDRLSRENPWDAVPLLCNLVNAGVTVVTLSPAEMIYQRGRDLTPLILAVVEFTRGHSESAVKSDRVGKAWQQKRKVARQNGTPLTRRLPAWVEESGGKLLLIPESAEAVRRIFTLSAAGGLPHEWWTPS
jgi:DNA invertase Pin-like site-specific DNA recombinase